MQAYRWTAERVLRELNSAPGGLSRKQAAARLAKHGENRLARKKGDSLWRRFMLQLSDPMILVLLAAAAVSAVLCVVHREFPADVLIIMTVVTVNAVLGVVQESKAEKAIAALQEMTPATSRVLRGGAECTGPAALWCPAMWYCCLPVTVFLQTAGCWRALACGWRNPPLPASPSRWKNPRLLCRTMGRRCRPPLAAIWYLWVPMWCTAAGVLW